MLLNYDIAVVGAKNVDRALASIERRMGVHNARVARMFGQPSRGGAGAAKVAGPRDSMGRGFGEIAKAANLQIRRDQRVSRARERAEQQAAVRRAAAEKRVQDQSFRRKVAMQNRQFAAEQRASERIDRTRARDMRRVAEGRASFVQSTVGNSAGRVGGAVRAVGSTGAALAGLGGVALGVAAVSQAGRLDEISRRLSIQGRDAGQEGRDPEELRRRFTQLGIAHGIAPERAAASVQAFTTETGDLDQAMTHADTFATVAQGADADAGDIGRIAAHMRKLGITAADDMREAFAKLVVQGKKGSFELKAMATELPEVLSSMAAFGFKGHKDLTTIGGMMQVAQQATGNASESTTAVQNAMRQIIAKSPELQSGEFFGGNKVQIFEGNDPTKPLRGLRDIFGDLLAASKGNIVKLNDLFEIRGSKAFSLQAGAFRAARETALQGGASPEAATAAGRKAAMAVLEKAADVESSFAEVERDATDAMKAFSVQMEIFNTQLKEAVASQLFPEIVKLTPELLELIPAVREAARMFVSLVKFLADNPLAGLGAALAASLVFEMSKARIGSVIGAGVTRMLEGTGGAGSIGGAAVGGAAGASGAAPRTSALVASGVLTGAAIGTLVGATIFAEGVVNFHAKEASIQASGANVLKAESSKNEDEVRKLRNEELGRLSKAKQPSMIAQLFGDTAVMLNDLIPGTKPIDREKARENFAKGFDFTGERRVEIKSLEANVKRIEEQLKRVGDAATKAADELEKVETSTLNRGNSPTPPKASSG